MEKQTAHYSLKHREYFAYVEACLYREGPIGVPSGSLQLPDIKAIEEKLLARIEQLQGEPRDKLIDLCRRLGLADRGRNLLKSRSHRLQVAAAYNLGVLRDKDSVPALLELLEKEPYGSSLFVFARAVAKCSQDISGLRRMLQLLVEHRKQAHELIADIMLESSVDYIALMRECLDSGDEELITIALIVLRGNRNGQLAESLVPLMESVEKEVRLKAVQAWLRQDAVLPPDKIAALFNHRDWEIRAEAAKEAGELASPYIVELLKEAMKDNSWWVRYYSAKSLGKLDDAGFEALCETAVSAGNKHSADMAQVVIHEELRNPLVQSSVYNKKRNLYKQYFRQAAAQDKSGVFAAVK